MVRHGPRRRRLDPSAEGRQWRRRLQPRRRRLGERRTGAASTGDDNPRDASATPQLRVDDDLKLRSFLHAPVAERRVGFAPRTRGALAFVFVEPDVALPSPAASAAALFSGPTQPFSPRGRDDWLAVDPAFSLSPNCDRGGVNVTDVNDNGAVGSVGDGFVTRVRLGILANNNTSCPSTDSFVGIGGSNPVAPAGALSTTSAFPRYAALLVRSADRRDVRAADGAEFADCAAVLAAGHVDEDAVDRVAGVDRRCPIRQGSDRVRRGLPVRVGGLCSPPLAPIVPTVDGAGAGTFTRQRG